MAIDNRSFNQPDPEMFDSEPEEPDNIMDKPIPRFATPTGKVNQVKEQRLINPLNTINIPIRDSHINKGEEVIKVFLRGLVAGRPLVIRNKTAVRLQKKTMGRTDNAEKTLIEIIAISDMPEALNVIVEKDTI